SCGQGSAGPSTGQPPAGVRPASAARARPEWTALARLATNIARPVERVPRGTFRSFFGCSALEHGDGARRVRKRQLVAARGPKRRPCRCPCGGARRIFNPREQRDQPPAPTDVRNGQPPPLRPRRPPPPT